jgi:hypothetical protein
MKKIFGMFVTLVAVVMLQGCGNNSVGKIIKAYESNGVKADQVYKEKRVEFTAKVAQVDQGWIFWDDNASVKLASHKGADVYVSGISTEQAAELKVGKTHKFSGELVDAMIFDGKVDSLSFINVEVVS